MVFDNLKISTFYSFLKDVVTDTSSVHLFLEQNIKDNTYRFKCVFNEFCFNELVLITQPYANRKYVWELCNDMKNLFNLKSNRI